MQHHKCVLVLLVSQLFAPELRHAINRLGLKKACLVGKVGIIEHTEIGPKFGYILRGLVDGVKIMYERMNKYAD